MKILLLAIMLASSSPYPAGIPEKAHDQKPPADYQSPSHVIAIPVTQPKREERQNGRENQTEKTSPFLVWCERYQTPINLGCTFFVAVFTGVLTFYTVKMWKTSKQELRAYIDINGVRLDPLVVGRQITGVINIKNMGQTPAYKLKYWADLWVSDEILTGYTLTGDGSPTAGHMGPGNEFPVRVYRRQMLTQVEHDNILDGKYAVFFAGRIEYSDAFKEPQFIDFKVYYMNRAREDMNQPLPMKQADDDNDAS